MFDDPAIETRTEPLKATTAGPAGAPVAQGQRAKAKVAGWWPKGVERCDPEPAAVAFTRRVVAQAEPIDPQQAGQALAFCFGYATWLLDEASDKEHPPDAPAVLDEATIFGSEMVGAYLDGPLAGAPKGTRNPTRSILRSLEPGSHLPRMGRTRTLRASAADRPAGAEDAGQSVAGSIKSVAERIEEIIPTAVPAKMSPSRFEPVADLVRAAVRAIEPASADRAANAMAWCAYLCAWVDAKRGPLRTDYVFHPDTVEEYLQMRLDNDAHARSIAAEASLLRAASKAQLPTLRARKRVVIARPTMDDPYSPGEIDSLIATATRLGTKKRSRYALAVLALGLSVGPHGGEYAWVAPEHIVEAEDRAIVTLRRRGGPPRVVAAMPEFVGLLLEAKRAALAAGDTWMLGGHPDVKRMSAVFTEIDAKNWAVPLRQERLRSTFLVALMLGAHSVPELLEQSGIKHLSGLQRLEPFVLRAVHHHHLDGDGDGDGEHDDDDDVQHDDVEQVEVQVEVEVDVQGVDVGGAQARPDLARGNVMREAS